MHNTGKHRNEGVSNTVPGKEEKTMVKQIHPHTSKHAPGQTVYERYLRTEELLSLPHPSLESVPF
jgi:hypothetical protein